MRFLLISMLIGTFSSSVFSMKETLETRSAKLALGKRLIAAINAQDTTQACYLIDQKADLDIRDASGACPLLIATMLGELRIVQTLLNAHAAINAQDSDKWTALMIATRNRKYNIMRTLIAAGADKTITSISGQTAITMAAGDALACEILNPSEAPQKKNHHCTIS
jgi:ankyrin repeat protein